jgi:hypothetical protein
MSFEIARRLEVKASFAIDTSDQLFLSITTRLRDLWGPAILIRTSSANNSPNRVAVSNSI